GGSVHRSTGENRSAQRYDQRLRHDREGRMRSFAGAGVLYGGSDRRSIRKGQDIAIVAKRSWPTPFTSTSSARNSRSTPVKRNSSCFPVSSASSASIRATHRF